MKNIRRHPVDLFCLLLLLLLFALSAMLIAVLGSSVYRRILDRTDRTQDSRLVCAYLTQKIRQLNHVGGLSVETRDGVPVTLSSTAWTANCANSCIPRTETPSL